VKEREKRFEIYLKTNIYEIGREVKECEGGRTTGEIEKPGGGTGDVYGWLSREAKKNEEAREIKARA